MNDVSHQHDKTFTDDQTEATIGSDLLPIPLNWKVLVQPNQVKTKTTGGIFLPESSKNNEEYLTAHGSICALGDLAYRDRDTGKRWRSDVSPKVGDRVTYGKYAGQKIVIKGVKFLLLNDDEITSILPDGVDVAAYVG
jgi:chaperonin GroES|tara:strand:+ start:206 stop:619 length:414 start_codon:yes stop_codon:yes gene_type:complete